MSAIRPEAAGDVTAIRRVHVEAFGRRDEADLVDALRLAGALRVALVAVKDGAVVGYVAFSPVVIRDGASVINALGLAPMAVLPGWQRRGVGSRLVRAGLTACLQPCTASFSCSVPRSFADVSVSNRPSRWALPGNTAARRTPS